MVLVAIVWSYGLGCIPGARIVARRHGVDLRHTGDGNPGAWNALEQLGWARAWPAFVIDGLKGALAAATGWILAGRSPVSIDGGVLGGGHAVARDAGSLSGLVDALLSQPATELWLPWACVAAAMLGHAAPLPRPADGGKSVMTFAGGAVALVPLIGVPLVAAFILAARAGRAAVAARSVVFAFPFLQVLVTPLVAVGWTGLLMTLIGAMFLLRRGDRSTR